jgi:hypothetical protein
MMRSSVVLFMLLFVQITQAQRVHTFWVELKSKDSVSVLLNQPHRLLSSKALNRRTKWNIALNETDVPVSKRYIDSMQAYGYPVFHTSRWFNALIVDGHSKRSLDSLRKLSFVKNVKYLGFRYISPRPGMDKLPNINRQLQELEMKVSGTRPLADSNEYGRSFAQIHQLKLDSLHSKGLNGDGVTIAILDAGFRSVNNLFYMLRMFPQARLLAAKDFVQPNTDVFNDDEHGLSVFSIMATHQPGKYIGASPAASYVLLRSEDAAHENLIEEALWIVAAEYADSFGVDLIQSSLGYNEFDDDALNHRYKELDGKTTLISKGALMTISKGITVVNSAGNEGDKDWRYIAAPADVNDVIAVGGVDDKQRLALFSSQGPTADKRIKPDVMALGEGTMLISPTGTIYKGNGTSYAAPLVAGLAACLLQAKPDANPAELAQAIRMSGSYYLKPDKHFGYGVPDALLALRLLGADSAMNLYQDQVLDVRSLPDKQVHMAVSVAAPQRIEWTVTDENGVVINKGNMRLKTKGQYRFSIYKFKRSSYALLNVEVKFASQTQRYTLSLNP